MICINIGIDIGGSHVGMGLVSDDGKILNRKDLYYKSNTFVPEKIFEAINDFIKQNSNDAKSVGIGIPGFATDTLINYTCNLPLDDFEITEYLKTSLPIYISNDANCATLAEYEVIDHKMYSNYILVTVGSGIGAGIILNGELYTGSNETAGEVGHMVIEKDGLECKCGRKGCFERYASISALLRMTEANDLKEVFYFSDKNSKIGKVFDSYLDNLSEGLANIINIYDPEMLVIGGGLSEYQEEFIYKLKAKLMPKVYNKKTYDFNVKFANLKNDAGIIGASFLEKYI